MRRHDHTQWPDLISRKMDETDSPQSQYDGEVKFPVPHGKKGYPMLTDLADRAYESHVQKRAYRVIDDAALLAWGAEKAMSPRETQLHALRQGILPARYLKNFEAINLCEQMRLCESGALVCGCGGLGGALIHLLARAGVGRLRLIDPDVFVPSNLNRQWMSDTETLGKAKAEVAAERVREINPFVEVEVHSCSLEAINADGLVRNMDLVLDALDNLDARFTLEAAARRQGVPFIHGAVAGWWGQVSTFMPQSTHSLEAIYGKKRTRDATEDSLGVLGPTAAIIGSLEAMEAVRVLIGREPAYAGRLLYFDGETGLSSILVL
jgi:molybdopterin-synthase adenylyltransferase